MLLILGSVLSFYEYGGYGIGGIIGALWVFTAGCLGVMSTRNTDNKYYRIGSLVFNIVAIFLAFINVILFTIAVLFLNTCSSVGGLDKLNFGRSLGISVTLDGCNSYKAGTGVAATLIFLHVVEFFVALIATILNCCTGCCKRKSQSNSQQMVYQQQQMPYQQQQMSPDSQTAQQQILPQHYQQSQYNQNINRNGILQNQTVPQNHQNTPQPQTAYYAVQKPEGTYYYPYQVMAPQGGQIMAANSSVQSMQPMAGQHNRSNQNVQPIISQSGVAQAVQTQQNLNMQASQIPQASNMQAAQIPQTSNMQAAQVLQSSNIQNGQITQPTVSQATQIPMNMQGACLVVLQLPNNQQIQGYLYIPADQQSILQNIQQNTLQNSQQNILQTIQQNTVQNRQQDALQNSEQDVLQNNGPNILQNNEPNILQNNEPNISQDNEPNILQNNERNILQNNEPNILQNNEPNILQNIQSVTPTLNNVTSTSTQDEMNISNNEGTTNVAYSAEQHLNIPSEAAAGSSEENNTDSMVKPLVKHKRRKHKHTHK